MASTGLAELRKRMAGRSVSGCAQRCACIETGAPGASSMSTHRCRFTWMAACGPPLTSSPKLTHRDTRTDKLSAGSLLLFFGSFRAGRKAKENNLRGKCMFEKNDDGQKINYIATVVT